MAHWFGAKGQVYLAKMAKTYPHCDVTHREPQTQNEKMFLNLNWKTFRMRRGFEQLSSSIGWWVMARNAVAT